MKRIWHPISEWEEMRFNMWGQVKDRKSYLLRAIRFTGNAQLYGSFMKRVCEEWPVSCENALTDMALNRKAWLGHAACALAFRCPEDIVRQAWGHLNDVQRKLANKEAERNIAIWELRYKSRSAIYQNMGKSMLFGWDTGLCPG